MQDMAKMTTQIQRAYGTHETQYGTGQPMSIDSLRNRVDMTGEEIDMALTHLARTNVIILLPASNLKTWSAGAGSVWFGGQQKHLFTWQ